MRHRHPIIWTLAVALALILAGAPDAHALPPQLMVTGLAMLGWVGALVASLVSLLAVALSRPLRLTLAVSMALVVVVTGTLAVWPPPESHDASLREDTSTLVIDGPHAAQWLDDPRTLWIDVRSYSAYQAGHVTGAIGVPLILSPIFSPRELDALAAEPTPLAHLAPDPSVTPDAWGELAPSWYRSDLALVEAIARIEAITWRRQESGAIDRVILYCYSGRTSTPLGRLLTMRGLPVHVVNQGINALPDASIVRKSASPEPSTSPWRLSPPSRAQLATWARYDVPPTTLPQLKSAPDIVVQYEGRLERQRAEWTAALLESWGYGRVRVTSRHELEAPVQPASSSLLWWGALMLLMLLTVVGPQAELRRRLASRPTARVNRALAALQLGLLIALQAYVGSALGDDAHDAMSLVWPALYSEPLRLVIALAVLRVMLRPRGHQIVSAIEEARKRFGGPTVEAWLWPRLTPGAVCLASAAGLCAGWAPAPIAVIMMAILLVEQLATWLGCRHLVQRVGQAADAAQAAARLLKLAGLQASRHPATTWVTTRREGEPGRATRVTSADGDASVGLWTGGPDVQYAVHIAATLGVDITLGVNSPGEGWASLKLLPAEPNAQVHTQLLQALWRGMRAGVPVDQWTEYCLNGARYDEVAPTPSVLTLDLLRRRASPEGASGDAARRFGWRRDRAVIVRLGHGIYDLERVALPDLKVGVVSRLATRAVIHEALCEDSITLRTLWQGDLARQSEESALAVMVATDEVSRRAIAAEVPAMPRPPEGGPQGCRPSLLDLAAPYELSTAQGHPLVEPVSLISSQTLSYGPGPVELQRWRGRLRAAEIRRDAVRAKIGATTQRLAEALRAAHGEGFFHARISDLPNTRETSEVQSRRAWGEAHDLPGRLTIHDLERLGTAHSRPPVTHPLGAPVGLTAPVIGTVTRTQPPSPGEIAIVGRVDPAALLHCPPGAAIVAERGAPLSHAAVIARERGVALVLGATGAVDAFTPGQRVVISMTGALSEAED